MTTILLIRHGENEYTEKGKLAGRLPGVHLSATGVYQARALAQGLKDEPLKAVYSSPLERAQETAKPLAELHKLKVVTRPGLLETDVGVWVNKTVKSLRRTKAWGQLQRQPSRFCFPGGESILEEQARLVAEIEALLGMHKAKDVIACVCHADPIKLIVNYYLGQPLDLFQRIHIRTASVSRLHFGQQGVMLGSLNEYFGEAEEQK